MRNIFGILFLTTVLATYLFTGCKSDKKSDHEEVPNTIESDSGIDESIEVQKDKDGNILLRAEHINDTNNVYNKMVFSYIRKTTDPLIASSRDKESLEWIFDRREIRKGHTMLIYHIGHDVADASGKNPRYATDGWVYIDSNTNQIYQYDLPNDSLILWKNNSGK
ncbi:MAG: hypothetical protein GC181_11295 [Bacteroidetes bacterium]|nr:hypothetical protein [Bacteroidota bacterium]